MRRGTLVSDLMRDMEISGFFHSFPRPSSTGHLQFLLIFFCDFHRVGYLLLSHCQNLPFSIALCSPLHLLRMSTWPGGFRTSILFFPSHLHSLVFNIETCYRVISAFFNQLTCLNVSQTSFKHVWDLNFILAWVH